MRLLRVEATDFAQWASLDLDLSAHNAIVVVGQNGAGKSRLLDAVLWSLFGRPARGGSIDRLVRWGQRQASVRTTWDLGGQEIAVVRTRSLETRAGESSLDLYVDGRRETRHSIAETEAELARLTRVTADMVRAGPVMVQGESDELLAARPAERFDVLAGYFGLGEYAEYHDAAKKRRTALAEEARSEQEELRRLEETIERAIAEDWIGAVDAAESEVTEWTAESESLAEEVTALREEAAVLKSAQDRLGQLEGALADARAQADRMLARRSRIEGDASEVSKRLARRLAEPSLLAVAEPLEQGLIEEAREAVAKAHATERQLAEVNGRLQTLKTAAALADAQGLCDHCPYAVQTGELPTLERAIESLTRDLEQLNDPERRLKRLTDEDRELRVQVAHAEKLNSERLHQYESEKAGRTADEERIARIEEEHADLTSSMDEVNGRIATLHGEALRIRQSGDRMRLVASELADKATRLAAVKGALNEARSRLVAARARLVGMDEAEARRGPVSDRCRRLAEEMLVVGLVVQMFHRDGIPAWVLARGVPMVEAAANEVLGRMPGGLQVELQMERQLKGGGSKPELLVVVDQAGQTLEYGDLGGGERFRIDFAIRVGVGQVRASLWETLWLDEPFSAQDPEALKALHQCLNAVAGQFGLMVVVTHSPETADVFPARLRVVKEDRVAQAEVAA